MFDQGKEEFALLWLGGICLDYLIILVVILVILKRLIDNKENE